MDAYLRRIGYDGPLEPTLETLRGIHLAHALSIPFENLDIQMGRPVRLDIDSLQSKLIRHRRGGYCFEHNALLAAALEGIGFEVTRLAARVRAGRQPADAPLPRTHMVLRVEAEGRPWLSDVGFGATGLVLPVPLDTDEPIEQLGRTHRVVDADRLRVLQILRQGDWQDLYAFSDEPQLPVDFEVANWWTSTQPSSAFVLNVTAQRLFEDAELTLRNGDLVETAPDGTLRSAETIEDDDELIGVLRERFGIDVPDGTRFRAFHRQ